MKAILITRDKLRCEVDLEGDSDRIVRPMTGLYHSAADQLKGKAKFDELTKPLERVYEKSGWDEFGHRIYREV